MHSRPQHCSKLLQCLSIQAALCCLADALQGAGADSPQQEATLLLQHASGLTRESLLCELQTRPAQTTLRRSAYLLKRRLEGEPLQYLLGESWFYGRRFLVDRRVLIPRSDSEVLVEAGMTLTDTMPRYSGRLLLADIGTGSGALAITLAEEVPESEVVACDRSREALAVARANRERFPSGPRVALLQCDLCAPCGRVFGGIVANLPYVRSADMPQLSRHIREHEPAGALDGGSDGLCVIRRMVEQAPAHLLSGGWLLLEVGDGQAESVMSMMRMRPDWNAIAAIPDLAGIPRVVRGRFG